MQYVCRSPKIEILARNTFLDFNRSNSLQLKYFVAQQMF